MSQCVSNAFVAIADESVSGTNGNTQAFFSVGDATDTDGDGLTSGESGYADFTMSGAVASVVGLNAANSYTWRVRSINGTQLSTPKAVASTGPHKTYVILGEPVEPWSNEPNIRNNAWSMALDLTCQWASGKTSRQQVATAVTEEINGCGRLMYDINRYAAHYTDNRGGVYIS